MPCRRGPRRARLRRPGLASQKTPSVLEGDPGRHLLGERGEQLPRLGDLLREVVGAVWGNVAADGETVGVGLEGFLPLRAKASVATPDRVVVEAAAGPEQRIDSDRDLR